MEKINTDFLDIAVIQANIIGQWNLNNGNGTFGSYSNFSMPSGTLVGDMFIKLRQNAPVKDLVVYLNDGLQVYWNDNGGISEIKQTLTSGGQFWTCLEHGIFNAYDNAEDVLVSNGTSTLYYCTNLNNGYLNTPNSISLPHTVFNFKLQQLNEKTEGYVQSNTNDRSDIIFINRVTGNPDIIYAYPNNNANGFNTDNEFANFETDPPHVSDLEVADLDGDGYNDLITVCNDGTCPTHYYARAYKNVQGQFINQNTLMWSANLTACTTSCDIVPKICVADINKDGLNDLIFVMNRDDGQGSGVRGKVFINQTPNCLYTTEPQETFDINESLQPIITHATGTDIYGGQQHNGGGIALLISYIIPINVGNNNEYHLKVVNSTTPTTNPPPPIVQGFLEYDHDNVWHPHIHLNYRGERDFMYYKIYKWKLGEPGHSFYAQTGDTGWTDLAECVDASGQDSPWWNCTYYVTEVDNTQPIHKESTPSQLALFSVGCNPICDACGGDNPNENLVHLNIAQNSNNNLPEKFAVTNYPNPFNPVTKIHFTLPNASKVKISVYNSIGQLVKELTDQWYEAGIYSIDFNGGYLSSGVYFYRIEAGDNVQTKKIVLLK